MTMTRHSSETLRVISHCWDTGFSRNPINAFYCLFVLLLVTMSASNHFMSSRSLGGAQLQPKPVPLLASQRSPRFYYWLAFFLFSLIVAGASIEATDRIQPTSRGVINQKFAVICSILSFCVSLCVVSMHFSPVFAAILVGSRWEGAVSFIMVALWSTLVAVISDPNNGLAVDNEGSVVFGNLYYCGWGGFVCAILLILNYLKHVFLQIGRASCRERVYGLV